MDIRDTTTVSNQLLCNKLFDHTINAFVLDWEKYPTSQKEFHFEVSSPY